MGEVTRISVSLKVNTGDETYWSLIKPLQENRQLSTFIITCLKAYAEDGDIHEAIDAYTRKGSGIERIKGHIDNLIKLQAMANRTGEDIRTSLSGDASEFEIENIFDAGAEDMAEQGSSVVGGKEQKVESGRQASAHTESKKALPENSGALEKIIMRLDKLEGTVSTLYDQVGSNAEHISKIENQRGKSSAVGGKGEFVESKPVTQSRVTPVASRPVAQNRVTSVSPVVPVSPIANKPEMKEVKSSEINNVGSNDEENLDFSQLIGDFMSSVST